MFLFKVTDAGLLVATLDELHQLSYKMFISALQSQVRRNINNIGGLERIPASIVSIVLEDTFSLVCTDTHVRPKIIISYLIKLWECTNCKVVHLSYIRIYTCGHLFSCFVRTDQAKHE